MRKYFILAVKNELTRNQLIICFRNQAQREQVQATAKRREQNHFPQLSFLIGNLIHSRSRRR